MRLTTRATACDATSYHRVRVRSPSSSREMFRRLPVRETKVLPVGVIPGGPIVGSLSARSGLIRLFGSLGAAFSTLARTDRHAISWSFLRLSFGWSQDRSNSGFPFYPPDQRPYTRRLSSERPGFFTARCSATDPRHLTGCPFRFQSLLGMLC